MCCVDTIIVNYRTKELTLKAAQSVLVESESNEVLIVDNGSGDDSATWLQQDPRIRVITSDTNLGFGGGNNLGVRNAAAEFIFFLNSDATLEPGGLKVLLHRLEEPSVGVVAPGIYLPGGTDMQSDAQGIFPTPGRILAGKTKHTVVSLEPDWVSGVAMLLRRGDFVNLGGFDEDLFMYLEDVDLCKRYRDAGYRVVRELAASVIHLGGASKTSTREQKKQFQTSTDLYLRKHGFSASSRVALKAMRSVYNSLRES